MKEICYKSPEFANPSNPAYEVSFPPKYVKPSRKIFLLTVPRWYFFLGLLSCVVMFSPLFISALWSVSCWERADLLALVCDVCVFFTFPCNILGHVWYLILSIPDLCPLSYWQCKFVLWRQQHWICSLLGSSFCKNRNLVGIVLTQSWRKYVIKPQKWSTEVVRYPR